MSRLREEGLSMTTDTERPTVAVAITVEIAVGKDQIADDEYTRRIGVRISHHLFSTFHPERLVSVTSKPVSLAPREDAASLLAAAGALFAASPDEWRDRLEALRRATIAAEREDAADVASTAAAGSNPFPAPSECPRCAAVLRYSRAYDEYACSDAACAWREKGETPDHRDPRVSGDETAHRIAVLRDDADALDRMYLRHGRTIVTIDAAAYALRQQADRLEGDSA